MRKGIYITILLLMAVIASTTWLSPSVLAQGNPTCPTRPSTDSSNACASTAFVRNAFNLICPAFPSICVSLFSYANPVWYGADPTGVVDSTAQISSAFSASKVLLFPCGTFLATIVNYPTGGGTIQGEQRDCAVIKLKAGQSCCQFINMSATFFSTSVMRDITIECNGQNQSPGVGFCISGNGSQYEYFVNITVQNAHNTAMYLQSGGFITGSQIAEFGRSGTGNGITIAGTFYDFTIGPANDLWQVVSVGGSTQGEATINLAASENSVRIFENNIDANGTQIWVNPGVQNSLWQIENNSIHCGIRCFDGVVLNNTIGAQIIGNQFFAIEGTSIHLMNGSAYNSICGNSIIVATPPIQPVWGIKEDAGVGPNNYCGDRPTDGNPMFGTFASGEYSVNGPTPDTGAASVVGCITGTCTDSTDQAGRFVTGNAVTSSKIDFAWTYTKTPACLFTPETGGTSIYTFNQNITTASFTVGFSAAVTAMTVAYRCSGVR